MREVAGIGAWFREEITAYDRPRSYSYLIVRSFPSFKHEGGTLTFAASAANQGTHVDWLTNYTHPIWAGGRTTGSGQPSVAALELPLAPHCLREALER